MSLRRRIWCSRLRGWTDQRDRELLGFAISVRWAPLAPTPTLVRPIKSTASIRSKAPSLCNRSLWRRSSASIRRARVSAAAPARPAAATEMPALRKCRRFCMFASPCFAKAFLRGLRSPVLSRRSEPPAASNPNRNCPVFGWPQRRGAPGRERRRRGAELQNRIHPTQIPAFDASAHEPKRRD
jgi:hypothetical protein